MDKGFGSVEQPRFLFINLKSNRHSRTRNYFNGLKKLGVSCEWIDVGGLSGLKEQSEKVKRYLNGEAKVVITAPSHVLVLYFVLLFYRKPVLDAGWPLYDGVISSRRQYGVLGINLLKTFVVDFFAFHLTSKVLVESEAQAKAVSRRYFVGKRKISVLLTGFDEVRFGVKAHSKSDVGINILFRGGAQDEAGIEILAEAIHKVKDLKLRFRLITSGFQPKIPLGLNVELVNEYVSDEELEQAFAAADLVLGQLSNHKRLNRTIPHKFFEAAFLGKPYLSSDKGLMKELSELGLIFTFAGGDVDDLAKSMVRITQDLSSAKRTGVALNEWYLKNASQLALSKRLLELVSS